MKVKIPLSAWQEVPAFGGDPHCRAMSTDHDTEVIEVLDAAVVKHFKASPGRCARGSVTLEIPDASIAGYIAHLFHHYSFIWEHGREGPAHQGCLTAYKRIHLSVRKEWGVVLGLSPNGGRTEGGAVWVDDEQL